MCSTDQLTDPNYQRFKVRHGFESYGMLWELEIYLRTRGGQLPIEDLDLAAKAVGTTQKDLEILIDRCADAHLLRRTKRLVLSDKIIEDVRKYDRKIANLKRGNVLPESGPESAPESGPDTAVRKGKVRKGKEGGAGETNLPAPINAPECAAAWAEWLQYKRERGERYKSPRSIKAKLTSLAKLGPARMVAAIRWSIEQNYQGIFEPRPESPRLNGTAPASPPRPPAQPVVLPHERPGFQPARESPEEVKRIIEAKFGRKVVEKNS